MQSLLSIRVQKLFLLTILLKVGSSFLGWLWNSTWLLGFTLPLLFMVVYIVLGLKRKDDDVSAESFADSCYYLGFIFTITSIIFSLFDLPNIGSRISEIAVRFGAAMVSTVFGLVVRVYLVSFRKDATEAVRDVQDSLIEATRRFREQLVIAFERLKDFQATVDTASKESVERVNLHVEALSKNHAEKLNGFFADLAAKNQEALSQALNEVKAASMKLSESVDGYATGLKSHLSSIESKVSEFAQAVTGRLASTTFPDDYFAKNLAAPLSQLSSSSQEISTTVLAASREVAEASESLKDAFKSLRSKAKTTDESLDKVIHLSGQQQTILDSAQGQLTVLGQLSSSLATVDVALKSTLDLLAVNADSTKQLGLQVSSIHSENAEIGRRISDSLDSVSSKILANSVVSEAVSAKLDATLSTEKHIVDGVQTLNSQAQTVVGDFRLLVQQMEKVASQLARLQEQPISQHQSATASSLPIAASENSVPSGG